MPTLIQRILRCIERGKAEFESIWFIKVQVESVKPSILQIHRGYSGADIEMLRKNITDKAQIYERFFIDGFGYRTLFERILFAF